MIERADGRSGPHPLSRRLLVSGLGFWGVTVGGAFAPGVLRTMLYPNHAEGARLAFLPADALGAPFLWSFFVAWCVSWAFVLGHVTATFAAGQARHPWGSRALLLLSLASPLAFSFAISLLLRLATRDAWHADGALTFLPASLVQLAISQAYLFLMGVRFRVGLPRAEGA